MSSSSNRFFQPERTQKGGGNQDDDILSQASSSNSNVDNKVYSTSHPNASDVSVHSEISQYRNQLRTIHGRMQQTAALGESLVSTEHELQLYLKELKEANPSSSSLQDAFDEQQAKKSQELQQKIKTLTKKSEDIVVETTGINRSDKNDDALVCWNTLNSIRIYCFQSGAIFPIVIMV